jgi:hypothetical protein
MASHSLKCLKKDLIPLVNLEEGKQFSSSTHDQTEVLDHVTCVHQIQTRFKKRIYWVGLLILLLIQVVYAGVGLRNRNSTANGVISFNIGVCKGNVTNNQPDIVNVSVGCLGPNN